MRTSPASAAERPTPIPRLGGGTTLIAMYQGGRGCRRTRAERRADRPYRPAPDSVLRRASGPARQPRVRRQPNAPVHHEKGLIPRSGKRLHLAPKPPFDLNLDLAWRRSPSVLVTPTTQGPPLFYALTLPASLAIAASRTQRRIRDTVGRCPTPRQRWGVGSPTASTGPNP